VTLKIKFADFQIITRSRSLPAPIPDRSTLATISAEILAVQFPMRKGVRLIGVSLSSLCADAIRDADPQMNPGFVRWQHRFVSTLISSSLSNETTLAAFNSAAPSPISWPPISRPLS
jgi:hypothetical protein